MAAQHRYSAAIIGLGSRGQKAWFESLRCSPDISVDAVCDSSAAVLAAFSARSCCPAYPSLERLLEHHRPDFAIVCVPNRHHLGVIKQLAAAGVPCLKEKPIAGTVEEFLQLRSLASKGKIGVTFQRRWQPRYRHFRRLLAEVGRPLSVRATMAGKYDPPKDGWRVQHNVGTFDDLGVHMLDVLVWLFGRPSTVFAHCLADGQPSERDRESHVLMTWQDFELSGHLYVSEVALDKEECLLVRGTLGSLHLRDQEIVHYDFGGRQTFRVAFQSRKQDVIASMCRDFCDYISGEEKEFSTSISQMEDTLLTTEAINSSFASHALEKVAEVRVIGRQNGHANGYQNGHEKDQNGRQNGHLNGHHNGYWNGHGHGHQNGKLNGCNGKVTTIQGNEIPNSTPSQSNGSLKPVDTDGGLTIQSATESNHAAPKTFLLNNGYEMPGLGFGTRKPKKPNETYDAVREALKTGYRHIDTAFRYNNEEQVGQAVRDSGLPRQAVWVTTKIDNSWHHRVAESVRISLSRLGLDYIDLVLMHWPSPVDPDDTKRALSDWNFIMTQDMQKEVHAGRVRAIGVSNFGIRNMKRLLSHPSCTIVPAVNQLELHPYCPSTGLVAFCREKGIHCTAYSPLAFGLRDLHGHPVLEDVCARTGKTTQQVLIRWGLQRGTSVIPKSVSPDRITANFEAAAWELSPEDHAEITSIEGRCRVYPDDWLPAQVFWEEDD
ncbi:Aldo/keto reductase [Cordyceps fumosorosea ARSEF 2679]|uniref:Aldo/keto reductase n=1 Tax=Cordyceps fumosorosea (strain ARSEF 2679) TaxID=1081104 RepID=A0A162LJI7_CORFA|nr:Aldo/keto reductase [Cordyceps fumosorosea ARSEF 2679]OAA71434.1 Aldo/keto reductase [Cordyceps fumosorosea ARSEF 2679]